MSEPRRLGDILGPALARLATTDQARAYGAWTRAAGAQVAGAAHPRRYARGVLTVECTTSVWAQELTFLSGQLLARMDEVSPGHPVRRFRFVVATTSPPAGGAGPAVSGPEDRGRRDRPASGGRTGRAGASPHGSVVRDRPGRAEDEAPDPAAPDPAAPAAPIDAPG